jgi:hypothetical protein
MDNPHPLDILGDPAAYGNEGAISRYHNPDHYTKSLGGTKLATTANGCYLHHAPSTQPTAIKGGSRRSAAQYHNMVLLSCRRAACAAVVAAAGGGGRHCVATCLLRAPHVLRSSLSAACWDC